MPKPPRTESEKGKVPPGAFQEDGSWRVHGRVGEIDGYIRGRVAERVHTRVTPSELASRLRDDPFRAAFPMILEGRWDDLEAWEDWPMVQTATSAEESVKRNGVGVEGHWEGGLFVAGLDSRQGRRYPPPKDWREVLHGLVESVAMFEAGMPLEVSDAEHGSMGTGSLGL